MLSGIKPTSAGLQFGEQLRLIEQVPLLVSQSVVLLGVSLLNLLLLYSLNYLFFQYFLVLVSYYYYIIFLIFIINKLI
jgi:hypothetical protein